MDAMNVVVLAGPNGAGKSTTAKKVIRDQLGIHHYVNADTLARGLSEFASEDMALNRVKDRVRRGGHNIPEETIRRRYEAGLQNFFRFYAPLADFYQFFNNSNPKRPRLIAEKNDIMAKVKDQVVWEQLQARFGS